MNVFTGKPFKPSPKVTFEGKTLKSGIDYTLVYRNNVKAGTAKIVLKGRGLYIGTIIIPFAIAKATQALNVKPVKQVVDYSTIASKSITMKVPLKFVTKAFGKVTYVKVSGAKCITINKKTGKVTIKKGAKRGTFKFRIKVSAAGNNNYKARSKLITCTMVVK